MKFIQLFLLLFAALLFLGGCSANLSKETEQQCAAMGTERLCDVAAMKGFVAVAMRNANDALTRGLITSQENEIIYNLAVEADAQIKLYETGADNVEGIVNIVDAIAIRLIEYNLTR